jgi:hypothetical protein
MIEAGQREDVALFKRQHETLRSMVDAFNLLSRGLPGSHTVDFEEPCFASPPQPLLALVDAAMRGADHATNRALHVELRGVTDVAQLADLSAAQFGSLVPLLTSWLSGDADAAVGFTLLHEGARLFGDELLAAREMRREWRKVMAVLSNLLESRDGFAGIDNERAAALLQHIQRVSQL